MIYNTNIVDFNTIFNTQISTIILETLHSYNLFNNNKLDLKNVLIKRFIKHFIIMELVKEFDSNKIDKTIVVVQPDILYHNVEILNYLDDIPKFIKIVLKILKIMQKKYPNNIILLKEFKDISNPDTKIFIFNKCNNYTFGSSKLLNNMKLKIGSK
jgi:hypothetical protein